MVLTPELGSPGSAASRRPSSAGGFVVPTGWRGGQAIDLASVAVELSLAELEFHAHPQDRGADPGRRVYWAPHAEPGWTRIITPAWTGLPNSPGWRSKSSMTSWMYRRAPRSLGKTAGKDAVQNKPTYVSVLGMARSRELAEELRCEALAALEPLGPQADGCAS